MRSLLTSLTAICLFAVSSPIFALEPADVFILANKKVPASLEVAEHYCAKRAVPKDHIIALDLPDAEDISRSDYDTLLLKPLRAALKDQRDKAKVLLTVYGVPLRVGRSEPTAAEKAEAAKLQQLIEKLQALIEEYQKQIRDYGEEIKTLEAAGKKDEAAAVSETLKQRRSEIDTVQKLLPAKLERRHLVTHAESEASVDSELSLLWWDDYDLRRWQLNMLYFQVTPAMREGKPSVLMVSRLDGPTVAIAKRLVDDAVAVEKKGLEG
jgi:hypothetical protein